jgi:putative phosphoesterase
MSNKASLKIGVLSDTHGHLDRNILSIFKGVDHILHAGDIGLPWLILELEDIAPVTAVLGNNDLGLEYRETEILQLAARKFLVHHIVNVLAPHKKIHERIIKENPDVVVFGHTHERFCQNIGQTLYFNAGYAGPAKGSTPRSVAILHCDSDGITAEYTDL